LRRPESLGRGTEICPLPCPKVVGYRKSLKDGSLITVKSETFNKNDLEHFNAQVQYLCKETLAAIEEALEKQKSAERPLVIFLVSDHGLHEFSKKLNTKLAEGRPFAAYYSSDGRLPVLDSFALPNMFRMILKSYCPISEAEFPLLPSRLCCKKPLTENGHLSTEPTKLTSSLNRHRKRRPIESPSTICHDNAGDGQLSQVTREVLSPSEVANLAKNSAGGVEEHL
jgi:hypothetical protein